MSNLSVLSAVSQALAGVAIAEGANAREIMELARLLGSVSADAGVSLVRQLCLVTLEALEDDERQAVRR